jgi:hypothetical protein
MQLIFFGAGRPTVPIDAMKASSDSLLLKERERERERDDF